MAKELLIYIKTNISLEDMHGVRDKALAAL